MPGGNLIKFLAEIGPCFHRKSDYISGANWTTLPEEDETHVEEIALNFQRKSFLLSGGNLSTFLEEMEPHFRRKSEHISGGNRYGWSRSPEEI